VSCYTSSAKRSPSSGGILLIWVADWGVEVSPA
jgi:hypothetical protein